MPKFVRGKKFRSHRATRESPVDIFDIQDSRQCGINYIVKDRESANFFVRRACLYLKYSTRTKKNPRIFMISRTLIIRDSLRINQFFLNFHSEVRTFTRICQTLRNNYINFLQRESEKWKD